MKPIFLFTSFFCAVTNITSLRSCNSKNIDIIIWDKNRNIKWQDFKASSPIDSKFSAASYVTLKLDYKLAEILSFFDVRCLFYKNESWYNDTSTYLLNHEQGHFDIGEIHARILRKELSAYKIQQKNITYKNLDSLFNKVNAEMRSMQIRYDSLTNHAKSYFNQEIWNREIAHELDSLKMFKR